MNTIFFRILSLLNLILVFLKKLGVWNRVLLLILIKILPTGWMLRGIRLFILLGQLLRLLLRVLAIFLRKNGSLSQLSIKIIIFIFLVFDWVLGIYV